MGKSMLDKFRVMNQVLIRSIDGEVSFDELADAIADLLNSNVYIMSKNGKILASTYTEGDERPLEKDSEKGSLRLPKRYNDRIMTFMETKSNLIGDKIKDVYGENYSMADKYHMFSPCIVGGKRMATILAVREGKKYDDDDIAICEYGATVVGLEVTKSKALEEEAEDREYNAVMMALETLSYSELDAVTKIFNELKGDDGLLVASKIADKSGITRSVIVNALRKLESAGVIESRSLGMKGTRIKITNPFLRKEIDNIEI